MSETCKDLGRGAPRARATPAMPLALLEHVNLNILDRDLAFDFYVTGLGGDYLTELAQKRGGAADAAPSSACHLLDRLAVSAASS